MDVVDLDRGQFQGQLVRPQEYIIYKFIFDLYKRFILLPSKCFFIIIMVVSFNIYF